MEPVSPAVADDARQTPFYSEPGLHVAIYDAMNDEVPGGDDISFFRSLAAESGGPVLELGCGTGRVSLPLAEAGFDVVGVDRSPAMLARASEKVAGLAPDVQSRLRFVEGDMTTADVGGEYGLVFAAFRVFMSMLDPAAQLLGLRSFARRLRPGGVLAIDIFDPRYDLLMLPTTTDPIDRGTYLNPETGRPVRVTTLDRRNDQVEQRFEEHWLFEELDSLGHAGRMEIESLTLRWTFRHEMRHLLVQTGLEPVGEYSDYAGSPPAYGLEQIWVARRPAT